MNSHYTVIVSFVAYTSTHNRRRANELIGFVYRLVISCFHLVFRIEEWRTSFTLLTFPRASGTGKG